MTTATLTLHSQSVGTSDGGGDTYSTSGDMFVGESPSGISASAIRFALPSGWDGGETVNSATLNLSARHLDGGNIKIVVRVLAEMSQALPSTVTDLLSAAGGSGEKTIGVGSYSPPLDHTLTNGFSAVGIDITDAMNAAQSLSRLLGGFVVLLFQPSSDTHDNFILARGNAHVDEPTIDLEYTDASPPSDGDIQFDRIIDDVAFICEITDAAFVDATIHIADVAIAADIDVPERSFDFDLIVGNIGLSATVESANNVDASIQIGDIAFTAFVVTRGTVDADIQIGDIGLTANAIVDDFNQLDVALTVGDVQLTAEAATGLSILTDVQIGDVQIVSAIIVGSRRSRDLFPNGLQSRSFHRLMY